MSVFLEFFRRGRLFSPLFRFPLEATQRNYKATLYSLKWNTVALGRSRPLI